MTCVECENRAGVVGAGSAIDDHEEGRVLVGVEPSVVSEEQIHDPVEGLGHRVLA